jgi:hypothetical protein
MGRPVAQPIVDECSNWRAKKGRIWEGFRINGRGEPVQILG